MGFERFGVAHELGPQIGMEEASVLRRKFLGSSGWAVNGQRAWPASGTRSSRVRGSTDGLLVQDTRACPVGRRLDCVGAPRLYG